MICFVEIIKENARENRRKINNKFPIKPLSLHLSGSVFLVLETQGDTFISNIKFSLSRNFFLSPNKIHGLRLIT